MSAYSFEFIKDEGTPIMCVFGCLLTEAGLKIKEEMLDWLTKKYDVICVNQEPPGTLYEWPALKFVQRYSIDNNVPVLYIHTKGAGHAKNVYDQDKVRKFWKDEFVNNYNFYNENDYTKSIVICPYTNKAGATWLNGFIASPEAWKNTNLKQTSDRYYYEHCFDNNKKVNVIGRIDSHVEKPEKLGPIINKNYEN